MTTAQYPKMSQGTQVRTTEPNPKIKDWLPECRTGCQWGVNGEVTTHSDSHGLTYEVRHGDGTSAWYDPSELEPIKGKLLKVVQLGNPVLFERAAAADIRDPEVQILIDDLIRTCIDSGAVGIAAPQVGVSLRIFIMASRPLPRYPDAPVMEPMAMINPVITKHSEEEEKDWEGCLSIPGIRGLVSRPKQITVIYEDREGNHQQKTLDGFLARIYQHEEDHLNGTVFLDRVEVHNLATNEEFERITAQ